jgi:hypothetical protein
MNNNYLPSSSSQPTYTLLQQYQYPDQFSMDQVAQKTFLLNTPGLFSLNQICDSESEDDDDDDEADDDDDDDEDGDEDANEQVINNSEKHGDLIDELLNDDTILTNDEIKTNNRLCSGKVFHSYENFQTEFDLYCKETYQIFTITKSEKMDESEVKFRVFSCIRHGSKKSKGDHVRENQSYNGCNCSTSFRINLKLKGVNSGFYVISTFNVDHNHQTSKSSFFFNSSNRKLEGNLKQTALDMLSVGSKPSAVALYASKKSGKIILPKDLFNLRPREHVSDSEANKLQQVIDRQIKIDGKNNFHYIENEDATELYGVFYQNNRMRRIFSTYSKVTFIDGTYVLNKENFPCINFVVTDHNREARVVAFALVACERQIVVDIVLDYFKKLNNTSTVEIAMIDKDLKEDSAISKAFPNAAVLYCFWHNENTFRQRYVRL